MTTTSTQVTASSVGSVRTFWAPMNGQMRATLTFRVGWADETLPQCGLTHMVEHLVLSPLGQPTFDFNGVTTAETTTFYCSGEEQQVAGFLRSVAANITAPALDRLEVERRMLRAEACHANSGIVAVHDMWRWGAQGHGLAAYDEYGLFGVAPEQVQAWLRHYFTADNASLWVAGGSLEGLELDLPAGERRPAVIVRERATASPAYFPGQVSTVSMSAEVPVGQWAGLVGWLLERRLMARLRYDEGVTYGVQVDVSNCGLDLRRVVVVIDGLSDHLAAVARGAAEVVNALATAGPTQGELDEWVTKMGQSSQEPWAVMGELSRRAQDHLYAVPDRSREQIDDEARALTPDDLRRTFAGLLPSLLWCVPQGVEVPGVAPVPNGSPDRISGTRFRPPNGFPQTQYLDVSDEGITVVQEMADEWAVTVRWTQCAAVLAYDDGTRAIIGLDGYRITLLAEEWARYDKLLGRLDPLVPPQAWSPQGTLPQREAPLPPTIREPPIGGWIGVVLGVALILFAWMIASVAQSETPVIVGVAALAATGCAAVGLGVRQWVRRRKGVAPDRLRRYRGIGVWRRSVGSSRQRRPPRARYSSASRCPSSC